MAKKRAPKEQLVEAGKLARKMLVDRGIEGENLLAQIMAQKDAPVLPGLIPYLPHRWTLQAAQRIMRDLLREWIDNEKTTGREENITEFFKFVIARFREQERGYNKEIAAMPKLLKAMRDVPVLKDIFGPMRKKETAKAMQRFFVDSFAVGIVLKNNDSVSSYANWFLDWTQELYLQWTPPEQRAKEKATV